MPENRLFTRLTKLIILPCLILLPALAFAVDDMATRKVIFDCEQKAAAYTKAMGKPGNKKLYEQHLKDCLEVSSPASDSVKSEKRVMLSADSPCKEDEYAFTFKNSSAETIWLGVWDGNANAGVPPPPNWPYWELASDKQQTWCAPTHFNGRFIIRARCNTSTGFCEEGNCITSATAATAGADKMTCTVGAEPASLAEFNFDDNISDDKPLGVTWYDVSYVDGYNFPILIESNDPTNCATLGKGDLPECPWPTINGVCLGPYKLYALNNPWYRYEQDYYTLAAMCASPDKDICGCGNQCTTAQKAIPKTKCETTYTVTRPDTREKVTLRSSGCSPFNPAYKDDALALAQVVCDPLGKGSAKCYSKWPEMYKAYVKNIHDVIPKAYTWQYHDEDSLTSCTTKKGQSFTITVGKRPASSKGNAYALSFNPDKSTKGAIIVNKETPVNFVGGNPLQKALQEGDKVTISNSCPGSDAAVSCTATFNAAKGLISDDAASSVCRTQAKSGIDWGDRQNVAIGPPSPSGCWNFIVYMADNFHAKIWKNSKQLTDIQGSTAAKKYDPYLLNLADKDNLKLVVDCRNGTQAFTGKTVTCTAMFDNATGKLRLDDGKDNDDCKKSAAALGFTGDNVKPNELHPGIPSDAVCK